VCLTGKELIVAEISVRAIFPVLRFDFESAEEIAAASIRDMTYLGTGFFLDLDSCVAFVTARHVVEQSCNVDQRIGFGAPENTDRFWWDSFEYHPYSDLAYVRLDRNQLPGHVIPLKPLPTPTRLTLGASVSAFGHPFSYTRRDPNTFEKTAIFHKVFFSGYVVQQYVRKHLEDFVTRPFDYNYELSFECPNGLSGAPLLVDGGGSPVVAGIIYGNREHDMQLDYYDKVDRGGNTEQWQVWKLYHFGLASDNKELLEIPSRE
jgi:Trypsin-like peptidase domain